ncbi:hypothetical protein IT571_11165 [Candidatus Sumerlaeota bacterium]|nr:hypothetical protein [Candidatus Sumerlaeota bacterium]
MTARILIMDYVVFAIGGLGALVAALRWRRDEILLQDLILTGVRPAGPLDEIPARGGNPQRRRFPHGTG